MEGRRPEGHSTDRRNNRVEDRRIEASFEGDQGPERGCSAMDGLDWSIFVLSYTFTTDSW